MPRARAASSSPALASPRSAACPPGGQAAPGERVVHRARVIFTSVTGARVVAASVIRFGAGRWPSASGSWQVAQAHLVPRLALAAFSGVPRIGVIRRDQPGSGRRESPRPAPRQITFSPPWPCSEAELLDPTRSQRLDRGQAGQPARRVRAVDSSPWSRR